MAGEGDSTAQRWLEAELAGRADEADRLFGTLAGDLTAARAPARLADRVALAVGGADAAAGAPSGPRRAAALVAVLVLGAVAAVWVLLAMLPFLGSAAVALLNFSAEGFVWVVRAVEGGLDGWAILRRVGRGLGEAVSAPGVTGGLVAVEFVGVAALYALHRLLRIGREPRSKEDKQW
ncbi:MAG: hypothetical protein OXH04_10730 [Acidobacteria bacterium]|nr:hypothetical protein [Acidobacteriota bacterium]